MPLSSCSSVPRGVSHVSVYAMPTNQGPQVTCSGSIPTVGRMIFFNPLHIAVRSALYITIDRDLPLVKLLNRRGWRDLSHGRSGLDRIENAPSHWQLDAVYHHWEGVI